MQICLYASYETAHATSDVFSFHLFKRVFNTATTTKYVVRATGHDFSVEVRVRSQHARTNGPPV